jgi:hypothetical protein
MDKRLLDEDEVMQICFVTHDVVKSAQWFSDLTGKPMPKEGKAAEPDEAKAIYNGKPADVGCRIMMFKSNFFNPDPKRAPGATCSKKKAPVATISPSAPGTSPNAMPIWNPRGTSSCSAANSTAAMGATPTMTPSRTWVS